jgi:3'(2'), 5'-bisphosphate nucleotidase
MTPPIAPDDANGDDVSETDTELAARVAWLAGRLLRTIRRTEGAFDDPAALGDRADREANDLILAELAAARPGDAVLSEESADDPARLDADRVWIVDPLDGTRQYRTEGRTDWAVHIALWERGESGGGITSAAVAMPELGSVFTTDVALEGEAFDPEGLVRLRPIVLVSDSRPPDVSDVVAHIDGVVAPMGSAGAKILAIVRGDADAYIHAGGQYEWDSAAPVAVALAHGFHASRLDGSPLIYNQRDTLLPDLVVCRPDLAEPLLRALTIPLRMED